MRYILPSGTCSLQRALLYSLPSEELLSHRVKQQFGTVGVSRRGALRRNTGSLPRALSAI